MNANEKLRAHIDSLFVEAPATRAAGELKEELLANALERYADLRAQGMGEEEALHSVQASIGQVDDLIDALPKETPPPWEQDNRHHSAVVVTVAVGLYILALAVLFVTLLVGSWFWPPFTLIGLAITALICIVPTCMLVYNAAVNGRYTRRDDTVVEQFKQWNADGKRRKTIYIALTAMLWSLCLVAYFLVSFATGAWALTWLIFLMGICLQAAVTLGFVMKGVPR